LRQFGNAQISGVTGFKTVNMYFTSLILPNNEVIKGIELCAMDNTPSFDIIIGIDIISK
jgi:hypothetical protein